MENGCPNIAPKTYHADFNFFSELVPLLNYLRQSFLSRHNWNNFTSTLIGVDHFQRLGYFLNMMIHQALLQRYISLFFQYSNCFLQLNFRFFRSNSLGGINGAVFDILFSRNNGDVITPETNDVVFSHFAKYFFLSTNYRSLFMQSLISRFCSDWCKSSILATIGFTLKSFNRHTQLHFFPKLPIHFFRGFIKSSIFVDWLNR